MLLPNGRSFADEHLPRGDERQGQCPGFEQPEYRSAPEQPTERARARRVVWIRGQDDGLRRGGERRRDARHRPPDEHDGVEASAGPKRSVRKPNSRPPVANAQAEALLDRAVPGVVQAVPFFQLGRGFGKRLPVHVVEQRREQQNPADPPAPGRIADLRFQVDDCYCSRFLTAF